MLSTLYGDILRRICVQCSIHRILPYQVVLPLSRRMNAPHSLLKKVVVVHFQIVERGVGGWLKLFKNFTTLPKKVDPSPEAIAFILKNPVGHHEQKD